MSIPSSKPIFPLHVLNSNPAPPTSDTASDLHLVVPSPNLHASNPPPLCCSSRLKNLHPNTNALLTKFLPLSNSHDLLPLSVADPSLSVDLVLSALADSSMEPAVDTGDDPSWTEALASLEREYWVVGAWEELQSLQDMQVFVLVPHSSLPPDVVLWKANLSVSVNAMILAKSFATKFGMWQRVMPNNTAWTMTRLLL